MHVAVIGAGAAGLCAARHLTAPNSGFTCVVFEQTDQIGGVWVFTENTGTDKYGLPVTSAVYKHLRTNVATQNMQLRGFPLLSSTSFPTHTEFLQYLKDYANHYDLNKHIKFLHHVKHVSPKDEKWLVSVTNLPENKEITEEFDAVLICSGHYNAPYMGDFPSVSEFNGEVFHSLSYRIPEPFTNKVVLVCGGGQSGVDISYDLVSFAKKVYLSHRSKTLKLDVIPQNLEQVPTVKAVKKDHIVFMDGTTSEIIDVIIMCTGYKYSFPFLAPECGITITKDCFIEPLYKHLINVNYPTMAFIGIVFNTLIIPVIEFQVRFFLKTLTGEVEPVSKEDMFADIMRHIQQKKEKGILENKYHELFLDTGAYIQNLAELAQLEQPPPVFYNIAYKVVDLIDKHLTTFKDAVFEVIDDERFSVAFQRKSEQNS